MLTQALMAGMLMALVMHGLGPSFRGVALLAAFALAGALWMAGVE